MSCDPRADHLPVLQQMTRSRATTYPLHLFLTIQVMGSEQRRQDGQSALISARKALRLGNLLVIYTWPHRLSSVLGTRSTHSRAVLQSPFFTVHLLQQVIGRARAAICKAEIGRPCFDMSVSRCPPLGAFLFDSHVTVIDGAIPRHTTNDGVVTSIWGVPAKDKLSTILRHKDRSAIRLLTCEMSACADGPVCSRAVTRLSGLEFEKPGPLMGFDCRHPEWRTVG
jgi:hypothetical protein